MHGINHQKVEVSVLIQNPTMRLILLALNGSPPVLLVIHQSFPDIFSKTPMVCPSFQPFPANSPAGSAGFLPFCPGKTP